MKFTSLTLFLLLFAAPAFCQSDQKTNFPAELDKEFDKGSGISQIPVNQINIKKLSRLGLIWGFLKYYHPNIAKGNFNWDYELFRILPGVLASNNEVEADALMVDWVKRLGDFEAGENEIVQTDDIKMKPDLGWIENLSAELSSSLLKIKDAKRTEDHYYVGVTSNARNPEFKHEDPYFNAFFPDAGFRLLALYRYWNIIQYYFPYKYLIEEDWKNVLGEFIPKMTGVKNETEYDLALLELIARVHDTHANIQGEVGALDTYFGVNYANAALSVVEDKVVITGFYDAGGDEGLKAGDVIVKVNNKAVDEIIKEKQKYTPASNYAAQLREITKNLLRSNDSIVHITYLRGNVTGNKILKTYVPQKVDVHREFYVKDTSYLALAKGIAYINNGSVKKSHLPEIWKNIQNSRGLIIDIRNYPSGSVLYELSKWLVPEATPFVKFTTCSIKTPGLFTFSKPLTVGEKNGNYYKGKVVILINEVTQSAAEFYTMAYRKAPNAVVIGSTTAAADGNVSQFYLPGAVPTMITGLGVYYPDGRETQRIGIIPDITITPTIQGIKNGRDEVLEKAIEIINKE